MRKRITSVLGILLLGLIGWYAYLNVTAETRVREVCVRIATAASVDDANKLVEESGMSPPLKQTGIGHVAEAVTFGRYACRVETLNGHIKSSNYNFAD